MGIAISIENVSKRYRIGESRADYRTLRESLTGVIAAPLRSFRRAGDSDATTFWALHGIDLRVRTGEAIGVIGPNGAGKSTLLKILSRITEPTSGRALVSGRVGSLLEVGTGFHPELTGRENIFLNGAILGMNRAEITRRFGEIAEFSEIGKFIDTPVKHYSSGMYVRLAFAVAAHLEPEILLVDEVLAVGDAAFQKKCLGKMSDVGREGRTVVFISHNMVAVESLCDRAVWLEKGVAVQDGTAREVVAAYLRRSTTSVGQREWPDRGDSPGNDRVRLRGARVYPLAGRPGESPTLHTSLEVVIDFWNQDEGARLNLSAVLWNEEGVAVFNTTSQRERAWHGRPFPAGLFSSRFVIPGNLLNTGTYRIELYVVRDETVVVYRHDDLISFELADDPDMRGAWHGKWIGAVRPELEWQTEMIST